VIGVEVLGRRGGRRIEKVIRLCSLAAVDILPLVPVGILSPCALAITASPASVGVSASTAPAAPAARSAPLLVVGLLLVGCHLALDLELTVTQAVELVVDCCEVRA
jgi:hypothetical protein